MLVGHGTSVKQSEVTPGVVVAHVTVDKHRGLVDVALALSGVGIALEIGGSSNPCAATVASAWLQAAAAVFAVAASTARQIVMLGVFISEWRAWAGIVI